VLYNRWLVCSYTLVITVVEPLCALAQSDNLEDPFLDLRETSSSSVSTNSPLPLATTDLFGENFTFKRELLAQTSLYGTAQSSSPHLNEGNRWYTKESIGGEVQKKFSTTTRTVGALDIQGRFVRRDNFFAVTNDSEGMDREGWFFEYHNLYLDLYDIANPLLSEDLKGSATGHFNLRVGRYYLPFGLNLQSDTHGTLLQLSNERNFGYERDWYAGLFGSVNRSVNYDLYYMLGSGYEPSPRFGGGMIGSRLSLSNSVKNDIGLEGGVSALQGKRRSSPMLYESEYDLIDTKRVGADLRYNHLFLDGTLTESTELSQGSDDGTSVLTQLYQVDYLHRSRAWGSAAQYRSFAGERVATHGRGNSDTSIIGELTWFIRNDIESTNLHWIKLGIERQLEQMVGSRGTITTLQYYRYW